MTLARDAAVDALQQPAGFTPSLASWYTQGLSDELGDRLLMFDNTGGASLELLRFRRALAAVPGFEAALRERVDQLRRFQHPAFAAIRGVESLDDEEGLALLSTHVPGKRLSEVLQHARGARFAATFVQQLAPALAALQLWDDGVGHGALAPNRIVIGPEGRLVIVEHVLGPALARLGLSPERFHRDFGIVVPAAEYGAGAIDSRTDSFQLALIALSLMLGRPVTPGEYPHRIAALLDEQSPNGNSRSPWLNGWLKRALQLDGCAFESSSDALRALRVMSAGRQVVAPQTMRRETTGSLRAVSNRYETPNLTSSPGRSVVDGGIEIARDRAVNTDPSDIRIDGMCQFLSEQAPAENATPPESADRWTERIAAPRLQPLPIEERHAHREEAGPSKASAGRSLGLRLAVAALVLIAVGEGIVIARLRQTRAATSPAQLLVESLDPGLEVVVDGRRVGATPLQLHLDSSTRSITVGRGATPEPSKLAAGAPSQPIQRVASAAVVSAANATPRAKMGGIKFVSPIALDVYEGDRRLGSTETGIVSAAAGRRDLELVNSVIGFRVRQLVDVRADRVVSVNVSPPNGRVNINAVPWAQVWIDGRAVGETPLANVSVPPGEHEIVFRHPELGEQRQTALVRLDGVTRVSASLRR